LHWELVSTNRARIVVFKPGLQAVGVETVPTWHEHRFFADLELLEAHVAGWWFKGTIIFLLAVLLFNLHHRQATYCVVVGWSTLFLLLSSLHPSDNLLKEVVLTCTMERPEVLGEVGRKSLS